MHTLVDILALYALICGNAWGLRHRGGFDIPLDPVASRVRWAVVLAALGWYLARGVAFPGLGYPGLTGLLFLIGHDPRKLGFLYLSIAFVAWPNLAYYLTWLLRWVRILPGPSPEYVRLLRERNGETVDDAPGVGVP